MVNPNYREINVKKALEDQDSVFYYYQKLIELRKQEEVITRGDYRLLEPESDSLYVYTRTFGEESLLVVCNFTAQDMAYTPPQEFASAKVLIHNLPDVQVQKEMRLRPYEALVLKK